MPGRVQESLSFSATNFGQDEIFNAVIAPNDLTPLSESLCHTTTEAVNHSFENELSGSALL
jgi:hypothetical protein